MALTVDHATRLVAYAAHGARLGVLPDPLGFSATTPYSSDERGALSLTYSKLARRGDILGRRLTDGLEIALEEHDGTEWHEVTNGRFLVAKEESDRTDQTETVTLEAPHYSWLLTKIKHAAPDEALYATEGSNEGRRQFIGVNAGIVIATLLQEYKDRGGPEIAIGFNTSTDSNGQPWPSLNAFWVSRGEALDVTISRLASGGAVDVWWDGRTMHAAPIRAGRDRAEQVILREGLHVAAAPSEETIADLITTHTVHGGDGLLVTDVEPSAPSPWGRWEGFASDDRITSEAGARNRNQSELATAGRLRGQYTRDLTSACPYRFGTDIRIGDWITAPTHTDRERVRVASLLWRMESREMTRSLILNDSLLNAELARLRKQRLGEAGTSGEGSGVHVTPEGQDKRTPAQVQGLTLATQAYIDPDGAARGLIVAQWAAVSTAIPADGSGALEVERYEVATRPNMSGSTASIILSTQELTAEWGDLEPGSEIVVKVRARGRYATSPGLWSAEQVIVVADDATPPPVPSDLVASSSNGVAIFDWDGLTYQSQPQPLDFAHMIVEWEGVRDGSAITGSDWLVGSGRTYVPQLDRGSTARARGKSVDRSGNESDWSSWVDVVVASVLDDTDLDEHMAELSDAMDARDSAVADALEARDVAIAAAQAEAEAARADAVTAHGLASEATTTAQDAHDAVVVAQEGLEAAWRAGVNLFPWGGFDTSDTDQPYIGEGPWHRVIDPATAPPGFDAYMETTVSSSQAGKTWPSEMWIPVQEGRTYRLSFWLWTDAPTDNVAVGFLPLWVRADGTEFNSYWGGIYRPDRRTPPASGEWTQYSELITAPASSTGSPHVWWKTRVHRYQAGYAAYGADGSAIVGEKWRLGGVRVVDVTEAQSALAAAEAASLEASVAVTAASNAQTTATNALTSANGRNSRVTSTSTPSGSTNPDTGLAWVDGDTWWQWDSTVMRNVVGAWTRRAGKWEAEKIGHQTISSVDVNKLTVTGSARMNHAAVDKIIGDAGHFGLLTAERLVVAPGNIFPDPYFKNAPAWSSYASVTTDATAPGGSKLVLMGTPAGVSGGVYYNGLDGRDIQFEAGASYRITFQARVGGDASGANNLVVFFRGDRSSDGTIITANVTIPVVTKYAWAKYEAILKVPTDWAGRGTVGFYYQSTPDNSGAETWFADVNLLRMVGGVLIEDGAVTANKLVVGDWTNLWRDADFTAQNYYPWARTSDGKLTKLGTGSQNGGYFTTSALPVTPGEKLVGGFQLTRSDSQQVVSMYVQRRVASTGSWVYGGMVSRALSGATAPTAYPYTVPADTDMVRVGLHTESYSVVGVRATVWDIWLRKQTGSVLIEDGAVTADKVKADLAMANHFSGLMAAFEEAFIGKVKADYVDSGVFTGKLFEGGTFTGSTFRTSSSTQRVQMDKDGLRAYNSSGSTTFNLTGASGSITGFTITGGTIRTSSSNQRAQLDGSNGGRLRFLGPGGALISAWENPTTGSYLSFRNYTSGSTLGAERVRLTAADGLELKDEGGTLRGRIVAIQDRGGLAIETPNHMFIGAPTIGGGTTCIIAFRNEVTLEASYVNLASTTAGAIVHPDDKWRVRGVSAGGMVIESALQYVRGSDRMPQTTLAPNLYMATNGYIYHTTSARRWKLDIRDIGSDPSLLLDVPVRDWIDKSADSLDETYSARTPGVVAEEVEAAGLGQFVTYGPDGEVTGVMYDRLTLLLIPVVRDLRDRITRLEEQYG